MKPIAVLIIALSILFSYGCVCTSIETPDGVVFRRAAIGYEAQIKTIKYQDLELEGYDGDVRIDLLIEALEAIR